MGQCISSSSDLTAHRIQRECGRLASSLGHSAAGTRVKAKPSGRRYQFLVVARTGTVTGHKRVVAGRIYDLWKRHGIVGNGCRSDVIRSNS